MERICEPELMDEPLQAVAYADADFADTDHAFSQNILQLLSRRPHPWPGQERIVDLGCGPGNITFRLAEALPQARVLGLDGAGAMLALAERRRAGCPERWSHLHFHQACLPLPAVGPSPLEEAFAPPYTLIVSNSLLHHLHDPAVLWQAVRQLAAPGALVVMRDLRRPPTLEALQELVERHASGVPAVLRRDYANSLAAAFRVEEVATQLLQAGLAGLQVLARDDRYLEVWGQLPL